MRDFFIRLARYAPWGLMLFFALLVGIAAIAPYATLDLANLNNNTATVRFINATPLKQTGLYLHAFASGVALFVGPFQFLVGLRQRRPHVHRWIGRAYLVSIFLGGLGAFIIAPGIRSGLVGEFGLIFLGLLWWWTVWEAYRAIRAGRVEEHREWMMRSYALTFSAVTLRLWLGLLIASQVPALDTKYGGDFDALFIEAYRVVMWMAWVPNLIIVEGLIQRRRGLPVR